MTGRCWAWGFEASKPQPRINKSLLLLFFRKEGLSLKLSADNAAKSDMAGRGLAGQGSNPVIPGMDRASGDDFPAG
jgi:hypothetical protein